MDYKSTGMSMSGKDGMCMFAPDLVSILLHTPTPKCPSNNQHAKLRMQSVFATQHFLLFIHIRAIKQRIMYHIITKKNAQ